MRRPVGAVDEQELGQRLVAVLRGRVQRREPASLLHVRIGAALQQERSGLLLAGRGRALERRHLQLLVACNDVDERASLDEEPGRVGMAEERGQVERREAVVGPGGHEPRVGVE